MHPSPTFACADTFHAALMDVLTPGTPKIRFTYAPLSQKPLRMVFPDHQMSGHEAIERISLLHNTNLVEAGTAWARSVPLFQSSPTFKTFNEFRHFSFSMEEKGLCAAFTLPTRTQNRIHMHTVRLQFAPNHHVKPLKLILRVLASPLDPIHLWIATLNTETRFFFAGADIELAALYHALYTGQLSWFQHPRIAHKTKWEICKLHHAEKPPSQIAEKWLS